MSKLISILMPVFNAEKWLSETISSVLSQTYTNWELIIVDDGSSDSSFAVAQSFAKKDSRIKVYKQENKGACAARNKAFELSNGEFIQYLDADDLLSENKIELQLKALENAKDENAIANSSWIKFKKKVGDIQNQNLKQKVDKNYGEPVNWLIDSWLGGGHGQTNCWLVPRHLIGKAGNWHESLTVNQDGEFFCRVLLQASQIVFVEEAKVYYRMDNPNSISQLKVCELKALSHLESFMLYEKHLATKKNMLCVQKALIYNYLKLLYKYDKYFPNLFNQFWRRVLSFDKELIREVVVCKFSFIARLFGFVNYLKIVRLNHKILSK